MNNHHEVMAIVNNSGVSISVPAQSHSAMNMPQYAMSKKPFNLCSGISIQPAKHHKILPRNVINRKTNAIIEFQKSKMKQFLEVVKPKRTETDSTTQL